MSGLWQGPFGRELEASHGLIIQHRRPISYYYPHFMDE